MARRSPARFLAPLALVAFALALLLVVNGSRDSDTETPARPAASQNSKDTQTTATKKKQRKRKIYTVKPGDTPSAIAEKTGVPLAQIEELNPDLDPQRLSPGDKIRLSP